jgi:hypothetical protein
VASDVYSNKIVAERSYMQASSTRVVTFEMCGNDGLQARSSFKSQTGTCNYTDLSGKNCPSTSVYLCYHDNHTYCFHHRHLMKKKWDKEQQKLQTPKCKYVFVRGVHQGSRCGKTITKNIGCGLCVAHSKQKEAKDAKVGKSDT